MLRKIIICIMLVLTALCFVSVAACGDNGGKDEPSTVIAEFDKYELDLLVGQQYSLTVKGVSGKTMEWRTSDAAIATVDDGVITAVGSGTATITMVVEGETVSCRITVTEEMTGAVNFGINKETTSIYVGYTKQLIPSLIVGDRTLNAWDYNLTFVSDNESAVSVSDEGVIEAESVGVAKITASIMFEDVKYEASVIITVKTLNTIEMSLTNSNLSVSGERNTTDLNALYYEMIDGDFVVTPAEFTYTSSDPDVATVNADGTVTAVSAGSATIRGSANGTYATCIVNVYNYFEIITTPYDFMNIANHMDGYYELNNDINFDGITFTPIGLIGSDPTQATPFTGTLNGNGYSVKNITHTISGGNTDVKFIFGYLGQGGVIENIGFENIVFGGGRAARSAGVVWQNNGTIRNVKVSLTTNG
ncbi:MAG: Ig-like domain-containing protein, partial [Clostridia bacterium]|nr:Ig-like domain-containing protein [Clostridia bacterium]